MTSTLGRFMSPDPDNAGADEGDPQSLNGYSYVRNNGLGLVDPDGTSYYVCARLGDGTTSCTLYANDQDLYKDAAASGVTLSGGHLLVKDQNGNTVSAGTYEHVGPGGDDTVSVPEDEIVAPVLAGGVAGGLKAGVRGLAEGIFGGSLRTAGEQTAGTAAGNVFATGSKAVVRDAVEGLANDAQKAALKRAVARAGSNATMTLERLGDGSIKVTTERAGQIGRQVIEKIVGPDGSTKSVVQKAFDASGSLVHHDPKF